MSNPDKKFCENSMMVSHTRIIFMQRKLHVQAPLEAIARKSSVLCKNYNK